ncbi:MAG TPA: DUF6519 domain-containing protein, partial [Mariprofundaceae bacterium]|nr:DUF6519 domain-containing protein [Mariprofundaceae bacterium]
MKSEISRDSYKPEKRYSGVYQQQGRMLTDADWNELVEILKGRLNEALKDVVGSKEGCFGGTPRHRALRIVEDAGSWKIQPGHIHVDGRAAEVPGADLMAYDAQPDFPAAPDLPVAPADDYVLYADVWERPVTYLENDYLRDVALHGADTCTRKQTMCQVKWCPAGKDPEDEKQNPRKGDAPLTVTLKQQTQQKDPCDPCAEEVQVESRIGNYLFRVEVHDVKVDANDPTNPVEITLKWSGENGAEQFAAKKKADMPDAFVTDGFVYEFFDEISEKHLGVHFTGSGNFPKRWDLIKGDTYPPTPTASFVRRWDGYCILNKSGNWKVGQNDQYDVNSSQPASISGNTLTVDLDRSLTLELTLELNHVFVAGDYWLVEVRENAIDANQTAILLDKGQPHGIGHRYLTLGKVAGGVLQPNPEADRKYAFPPLTEMTRIFSAGGDGQEAMPGQQLPQPLRVGVANGEWPVSGAKVRFSLESGDGALSISDSPFTAAPLPLAIDSADGLAQCYWQLGDGISPHAKAQCVKAELLGADGNPIPHPPIYFYANLSTADQVAYQNPTCAQSPSVNSLLGNDLGTAWPDLDGDGHVTVKDVLDALLCKLRAKHIPYDPTDAARWNDINFEEGKPLPTTVQEAIDDLADNLQSEDIKYTLPDCGTNGKTFKDYLLASGIAHEMGDGADQYRIKALWNALLCKLDAATIPFSPECDYLKNQNVGTVEAALNALCEKPGQG